MARLVLLRDGSLPRNDADRKVVRFLLESLPPFPPVQSMDGFGSWGPEYVVIPQSVVCDKSSNQWLEIDVLVIAPHAVFVLEVKNWGPCIRGNGRSWLINSTLERDDPLVGLHYKTRVFRSLIGAISRDYYRKIACEGVVVLTGNAAALDLSGLPAGAVFPVEDGLKNHLTGQTGDPLIGNLPANASLAFQKRLIEVLRETAGAPRPLSGLQGFRLEETLSVNPGVAEYLARCVDQPEFGALKRIRTYFASRPGNEAERQAFKQALSRDYEPIRGAAAHPNVLNFSETYDERGNRVVQVLERGEEKSLKACLSTERFGLPEKLEIIKGIALGLKACHDAGVVHNDLCPGNILITGTGPKIMNFDRDLLRGRDRFSIWEEDVERPGNRYRAPDGFSRDGESGRSRSADIYSLGAVFYELLCGDLPFRSPQEFYDAGGELPPALLPSGRNGDVPGWLDPLVARLYTCNPASRYADVGSFLEDLCRNMEQAGFSAPAETVVAAPQPALSPSIPVAAPADTAGKVNIGRIARLFQNMNLDERLDEKKKVSRKDLINDLNYVNFQDETILLNFRHKKYDSVLSLRAKPLPCLGDVLDCRLDNPNVVGDLRSYDFCHFLLTDGRKILLAKPEVKAMSEDRISFLLPETSHELSFRKVKRHPCQGIQADMMQNGVVLSGTLLEFSAASFRIEVTVVPPQSFRWINPKATAMVILKDDRNIIFSGECRILRQSLGQRTRSFALEAVHTNVRRFKPKEFRSERQKLSPSPNIIFKHPLTGRLVNLEVIDISGCGFSVGESYGNSVLMAGMIIPELEIEFANSFKIACKAQVIYTNPTEPHEDGTCSVRCGIAILDMDMKDQVKLSSLLYRVTEGRSYVCNRVDLDALWKFFFETGFFYPKKYALIQPSKEKLKETYEKLYFENPEIIRHFIYQEKGSIYGHISMIRFYENTWVFHHHAATGSGLRKAGVVVLEQIGRYASDFSSLYSTHMNFIASYFRPENKFPNRVFGGFTRSLNDLSGSSIDRFAYFHLEPPSGTPPESALKEARGELSPTQPNDLLELESFYEKTSGGLLLYALDMAPDMISPNGLNEEYRRLGFRRERSLYSLKKEGELKAIVMLTLSDIGLNLSNLTNCIHIIVLDQEDFPRSVLSSALLALMRHLRITDYEDFPVLLYPVSYAQRQSLEYEKTYDLWVFSTLYGDQYFGFMDNLLNRIRSKHS